MAETVLCDGCGKPPRQNPNGLPIPLKKCTRCRTTVYHDTTCQKAHYPKHKKVCRKGNRAKQSQVGTEKRQGQYFIEERPGRGKCLIASRIIPPGEIISSEKSSFEPFVPPVLNESHRRSRCCVCFGEIDGDGKDCNPIVLCELEKYPVLLCSETCRSMSRQWLPQEIECMKACNVPVLLPTAVLVFRLVWAISDGAISWDEMKAMQFHNVALEQDAELHQHAIIMTATTLLRLSNIDIRKYGFDSIKTLLSLIKVNAFTVCDAASTSLGISLYKTAYRINHSCAPNAVQSFLYGEPGYLPRLQIVASTPISPNDEITISYVDSTQPRNIRRSLLTSYHFTCRCSACERGI